MKEKKVILDSRLHVAVEAPRFLPGGHAVLADKTLYAFECTGYIGNTYYWTISDAKDLLTLVKRLVGTTTITQPSPELLSEQEVHDFIRALEHAIAEKLK